MTRTKHPRRDGGPVASGIRDVLADFGATKTDPYLELIEHQLNLLVSARMMDGLTEDQERRYRQLCELERTMRQSDQCSDEQYAAVPTGTRRHPMGRGGRSEDVPMN